MPWGGPREADAAALLLVHGLWDPTQARLRDGWLLSNLTGHSTCWSLELSAADQHSPLLFTVL